MCRCDVVIGEIFITFAFLVLAVLMSAALFIGWVVYVVVRAILNATANMIAPRNTSRSPMTQARCLSSGCGAMNPSSARFCRRCGRAMTGQQRVRVRRAAVW